MRWCVVAWRAGHGLSTLVAGSCSSSCCCCHNDYTRSPHQQMACSAEAGTSRPYMRPSRASPTSRSTKVGSKPLRTA